MARSIFLSAVCLLLASLTVFVQESASFELEKVPGHCHAPSCPNLDLNQSCNTGDCASGGLVSYWKIPLETKELGWKDSKVKKYIKGTVGNKVKGAYQLKKYSNVLAIEAHDASDCCLECKLYGICKYWQFVNVGCGCGVGVCFLYGPFVAPRCAGPNGGVPPSAAGAKCQKPHCNNDPHLVGARGTSFDFNGVPNKSFCLLTDRSLHINMKMTGYYDTRADSAAILVNGKAVRTWIRELGIIWTVNGQEHKLRIAARGGPATARGDGYLAVMELDDSILPRMNMGEQINFGGGLTVALEHEVKGRYDVDFYRVQIAGLLDMDMRLRVANPLLQTSDEAYTHISVGFNDVVRTSAIHGVLGQTYREDHKQRAVDFSLITSELHRPINADGESGKGFLDGRPTDYISTHVLSPDCVYSAYGGKEMPTSVTSE